MGVSKKNGATPLARWLENPIVFKWMITMATPMDLEKPDRSILRHLDLISEQLIADPPQASPTDCKL